MADFFGDLRRAARTLLKQRRITLFAVIGLALGIGLTTTVFSIVNGTFLRGLPVPAAERIMYLDRRDIRGGIDQLNVTPHDFAEWSAQQRSFNGLAAFTRETFNLSGPGGPAERYEGSFVSTNMFDLLGVKPAIGPGFSARDGRVGAEPVVILADSLWEKRFARAAGLLDQRIRINGELVRVVGIMPRGFAFPLFQDAWMPLRIDPLPAKRGTGPALEVIGRLKEGCSRERALADLTAIAERLAIAYPETNRGIRPMVRPYLQVMLGVQAIAVLFTMLAAAFGVLVIACVNVANLLLARASQRTREVAIRSSLGARRSQVIAGFLADSLVLALFGAAVGLWLAKLGVDLFNRTLVGLSVPFWMHVEIDGRSLLVVFGLMLLSSLLAGSIPAVKASGVELGAVLKDQARGASSLRMGRFTRVLVILEVALSCGLLVASGLIIESIVKLRSFDFGFTTRGVLTAQVTLPERDYPDAERQLRFYDELLRRVSARPGVRAATLVSALPATGSRSTYFGFAGQAYANASDYPDASLVVASPALLDTFGQGVLEGRMLATADDRRAVPVAVVNRSFRRRFGAGQSLVGRRIRLGRGDPKEPWLTIVGVIPDMLVQPVSSTDQAGIYVPLAQHPRLDVSLAVRSAENAGGLAQGIRQDVADLDRNLPVYAIKSMERVMADNTWFYNVFGALFIAFGLMALFLASIGLYGVMAFSVSRRTSEIGLRMALGATPRTVMSLMLKQGLSQLLLGMLLGLFLALAISRLLGFILFGVRQWDPLTFALVGLCLGAVGLLACFLPARSALRVDPLVALRGE